MSVPRANILLVDDEPAIRLTVGAILRMHGYTVDTADGGEQALERLAAAHYDLVLTDLRMDKVSGMDVLAAVKKHLPSAVTVMMTGHGSVDAALEALHLGAAEFLMKPVSVDALKMAVERSLERKRLSEIDSLYRVGKLLANASEFHMVAD